MDLLEVSRLESALRRQGLRVALRRLCVYLQARRSLGAEEGFAPSSSASEMIAATYDASTTGNARILWVRALECNYRTCPTTFDLMFPDEGLWRPQCRALSRHVRYVR